MIGWVRMKWRQLKKHTRISHDFQFQIIIPLSLKAEWAKELYQLSGQRYGQPYQMN